MYTTKGLDITLGDVSWSWRVCTWMVLYLCISLYKKNYLCEICIVQLYIRYSHKEYNMEVGWELPEEGVVKANVHAVFYNSPLPNGNNSGVGVVIRNSEADILAMVSGSIQNVNKRANELWSMLYGLRCCLYARKHNVILETECGEAVQEWKGWKSFVDPRHRDLIKSLNKRVSDKRLLLEISVVDDSVNQLARYLAEDGAANRTLPVWIKQPFGRVREIWHLDMGLGTTCNGFDLVTEEEYMKMEGGNSDEAMGEYRPGAEESRLIQRN